MSQVMEIALIPSKERGKTETDWLHSRHSFSFGHYHNLKRLNFGTLRVLNDDIIQPGKGFPPHTHDNMEIVTIVLEGAVEHKDNAGNHGVIRAGDVQRMTAGSGIEHSEYNASKTENVHFLQIWIYPKERNLKPEYEQKTIDPQNVQNRLFPIVSPIQSEASLSIHQDTTFFLGDFEKGQKIVHTLPHKRRGCYVFIIDGEVTVADKMLHKGDAAQITQTDSIEMQTLKPSKILLIEVSINTL